MMKKIFLIFTLFFAVGCGVQKQPSKNQTQEVERVIYMIGDGMGLAHVSLTMLQSRAPLNMERAQYVGLVKTHSINNRVTDSAASGTALASGNKTNNGSLGVDTLGNPLKNLTEYAANKGLPSAIVVTCAITHATPAAFYGHNRDRGRAEEIATELLNSNVNIIVGGGLNHFSSDKRSDKRDVVAELGDGGYKIALTLDEFLSSSDSKIAGMLHGGHMPYYEKRGDYLPRAVNHTLELMASHSPQGFFMMVEGSLIDYASHDHNTEKLVLETADFDRAVGVAMDFADKNPGTLVIVTADHETGGLSIPSGNSDFLLAEHGIAPAYGTEGHTGTMVPVYAYGCGAENFSGVMDNTDLPKKILKVLGLE